MRKKDYISGGFLFIVSIVLFIQTRDLTAWESVGPSEGFFPLALSIFLGVLSLIIIMQAWMQKRKPLGTLKILGPQEGKFILYIVSFIGFGLLFMKVGYSITLAAFILFVLRIVEKQSWKLTIIAAVISIVVSHVLFSTFLSVPLPEGILSIIIDKIRAI